MITSIRCQCFILHVIYVSSVIISRRRTYRKWVLFQSILRGDHNYSASPRMCVWIPLNSCMLGCRWTDSQSNCMSYWRLLGYFLHTEHLKSEFHCSPVTETLWQDGLAISLCHIKWRHQIMAYTEETKGCHQGFNNYKNSRRKIKFFKSQIEIGCYKVQFMSYII